MEVYLTGTKEMLNQKKKENNLIKTMEESLYEFKGKSVFLLKPNTYMNLSGKAVKYWMQKEKIPAENILIISDDLNIDFGTIRLKAKGSAGDAYRSGCRVSWRHSAQSLQAKPRIS